MKRWEIIRTVNDGEVEVLERGLRRRQAARLLAGYCKASDGWATLFRAQLSSDYRAPRIYYGMRPEV